MICDRRNSGRMILLNANEAHRSPLRKGKMNRYPDPGHLKLKYKLSGILDLPVPWLFTGNGSDEIIDLIIRGFCTPGRDRIVVLPPTYGMYETFAALNRTEVICSPLDGRFQPDPKRVIKEGKGAKALFLCSPNNPTGNRMENGILGELIRNFRGLVVVDEAYIDFSGDPGWIRFVQEYSNLVVLRTLSKGWGLAGIRVGLLAGNPEIIKFLTAVKPPYNISRPALDMALKGLNRKRFHRISVEGTVSSREVLKAGLENSDCVVHVYPSDANFLLVKFMDGGRVYRHLLENGFLVRDVSSLPGCDNCLRITVGNKKENNKLLKVLNQYREDE